MITISLFLFFYFFIFFSGRGISILLKVQDEEYFFLPLSIYYPIIGLFYIGNISLILNFFIGITEMISLIVLTFPLLFNFLNLKKLSILNLKIENLVSYLITPIIIGVSVANINLAYDAGLYHLNHQYWIKNFKIVLGLANNHMRYGYSSIIEHINVNFWLVDKNDAPNFILLHFTNLIFIVFFCQLILMLLKSKYYKFSISLLIYGFLDNFGFNGGKNGYIEVESITKQDTPFAIIFLSSTFMLYCFLSKGKFNISNTEIRLLFIFTLFATQLRILGAITLIGFFLICIYKFNLKETIKIIFKNEFTLSLLGILFLVKNLLTSGCFLYPVKQLCVDTLPWYSVNGYSSASAESEGLSSFHISLSTKNYQSWFNDWTLKEINFIVFKNLTITFSVILTLLILNQFIFKEQKNRFLFTQLIYCLISISIWLITAPGIRMGVGLFLASVFLVSNIFYSEKVPTLFIKYHKLLIIFYLIVIALIPQTNNYIAFAENYKDISLMKIRAENIVYIENESGFGVLPEKGDQCWVNLECVRNKNVTKDSYFSYIIFKD
jgi:hypothetical protein